VKQRVEAGTDAAMIGAWDASLNAQPMADAADQRSLLEADAANGRLFLLETGGDGGGPVDVYIDEAIDPAARERLREVPGRFRLSLPTGALVVGGGEDYRSREPINTSARSVVRIPPGEYEVRCLVPSDPEREPDSQQELERMVGRDELRYYDRTNRSGCIIGALILLLFPLLLIPFHWMIALPVTLIAFLGWFPLRARILLRSRRYQQLHRVVPEYRLRTVDPWLVLTLQTMAPGSDLKGGIASL